jgi:hypothetical protein
MKKYAPIALFAYNRPAHTRLTVEALSANHGASSSELFVFSDAPKNDAAIEGVAEVRSFIRGISGFAKVTVVEREKNIGLAQSIIRGVTSLCEQYGRVIVLEDDLVTAPGFLSFMNDGLDAYEGDDKVMSVCGYMYPVSCPDAPPTVFLRAPHSWGWATWKDRWALFDADGAAQLHRLGQRGLLAAFDANGPHSYTQMLRDQIAGRNDSWFIRWYAASLLNDRLSLYPSRSQVSNIGIDGSGVHCAEWRFDPYKVALSDAPVEVTRREPAQTPAMLATLRAYYRKIKIMRYVNFLYRKLSFLRPRART